MLWEEGITPVSEYLVEGTVGTIATICLVTACFNENCSTRQRKN